MKKAFTLIEVLVVVTILAVLAVSVFVALNPAKRVKDAQDARRSSDIDSILTAIHQYIVDNDGTYPTGLSAGMAERQLGTAASGCTTSSDGCAVINAACLDMSTPLAAYLASIPYDPANGTAATTHYSVVVNADGIVTVRACNAATPPISVSR